MHKLDGLVFVFLGEAELMNTVVHSLAKVHLQAGDGHLVRVTIREGVSFRGTIRAAHRILIHRPQEMFL